MIRKLREEHPQALCAVCGCWSQLSPEDAASIGADVVHGSGSKQAFVDDILRAFREEDSPALFAIYSEKRRTRFFRGFR